VKASTAVGKNALAAALEAGTPVEGISGYVSAKHEDAPIFVKVTCRGLVAGEDSCGIKVLVEVQSSKSQMHISPCQFFDSLDRVKTYQAVLQRYDQAYADYESITASRYLVNRREAVEENTGERFSFNEKLHAYADYVPDLQGSDLTPHTRALADVCLSLFNANEFAYVY
jgi:hypothetical protein